MTVAADGYHFPQVTIKLEDLDRWRIPVDSVTVGRGIQFNAFAIFDHDFQDLCDLFFVCSKASFSLSK